PRHRGLSMLLIPVEQPGVEVRGIRTMVDAYDLCEVFFDDAITSADLVLGPVHGGWNVAMGALGVERGTTLLPYQIRFEHELGDLIERARANGALDDRVLRDELTRAWVELKVLRLNNERMLSALLGKTDPGPVSSINKVYAAHWHQRLGNLKLKVMGAAGTVTGPDYQLDQMQRSFLVSRSETIYGGSDQIQHSIMAERILGLPR
ncbi:MAG: acyl-CoA dehydrogenase, partial [Acidimicrobiia bacterium]|nr:acyl-CoA dehydrogenase [Acidimicrobiia bacterium]